MSLSAADHNDASEEQIELEFVLGDLEMDETHREFLALVQKVTTAPATELATALQALFEHTRGHFHREEERMQAINHRSFAEHRADHQRILGDMERFAQRAAAGRGTMARAWVGDSLLAWFATHARTMDSALAADLSQQAAGQ